MNAQTAGLKAAILIEDVDDPMALRDAKVHAAADAALGYQLTIPYMKVFANDGKKLKEYVIAKRLPVYIKIDLGLSRPDNRVEYELWYSSILDLSKDQLVDLGKYQKPFGNHTLFTPRILTFSCPTCPKAIKEANCFSEGKYCPYQPKFTAMEELNEGAEAANPFEDRDERIQEVARTVADHELLMESLREKCLYEKVAKEDDTQVYKTWYNFMVYMQTQIAFRQELNKEASDRGFEFLDIDAEEIEKFVNNSFDIAGDYQSDNRILREDRAWQNLQQIHTHPAISINN